MDIAPMIVASIPVAPVTRDVTIRMTRDGEVTADLKLARMLDPISLRAEAFFSTATQATQRFLASAVDKEWIFLCQDDVAPRHSAARIVDVNQSFVLEIDLDDGTGSGGGGQPGTMTASVRVEGAPARRDVVAVERTAAGAWQVAGYSTTDADGDIDLPVRVSGGDVYVMASDNYGIPFQASLSVSVGSRVRPSAGFSGWLYEITEAGALPPAEPVWWGAEGENPSRPLGTARAIAVRYFRPLAHGPVPVEMI
jgi:hypothetical protein